MLCLSLNMDSTLLISCWCQHHTESLEQCDVRQLTGSTHHRLPAMVFGMLCCELQAGLLPLCQLVSQFASEGSTERSQLFAATGDI